MCLSFPRLFRVMVNKFSSIKENFEGEGGFVYWELSFRRQLRLSKEEEHGSLLSILSNVFICREKVDTRIWKSCPSSAYYSKSFTRGLEGIREAKHPSTLVWVGLTPPKVGAFCWLAVFEKVSTADLLKRKALRRKKFLTCAHFVKRRGRSLIIYCSIAGFRILCGVVFLGGTEYLGAFRGR